MDYAELIKSRMPSSWNQRLRRSWLGVSGALCFLMVSLPACAEPLWNEHFDARVPDFSPIGKQPGWQVRALRDGIVTDFTTDAANGAYPFLSHSTSSGAGIAGAGYLVLHSGTTISNAFAWAVFPAPLDGQAATSISFYTRNDSFQASARLVVLIGTRWYATQQEFRDTSENKFWALNTVEFPGGTNAWQVFHTNTLTVGVPLAGKLPAGPVLALGFFGQSSNTAKVRIDEVLVQRGIDMDPVYAVGNWIWAGKTFDRQTCQFWKDIQIPAGATVTRARLRLTADNSYRAFLDGVEFAKGSEWRRLTEYDLTLVLTPGQHVLAVEAFNEFGWAGFVGGLTVEMDGGRTLEIPTDASWRLAPDGKGDWMARKHPRQHWSYAQQIYRFRDLPELPRNPVVLLPSALQPTVIRFWQRGWFQILLLSFCAVIALVCVRLLAQLALQSKAQQVLQRERTRIARDIHDELGAGLTHLVLIGETAKREPVTEAGMQSQFDRVTEAGRKLLRSIDEVVWMVNSQRDSLQDFEAYVCRYAENFLRASGIQCRLHVDDEMPRATFDLASRRSLFLAVKESLHNISKHANATVVSLTIKLVNLEVLVTVEDDGKGFDLTKRDLGRNGLTNMMNRMAELGGRCHVTTQPGAGCKLELAAPLKPRDPKARRWLGNFFHRNPPAPPAKTVS